MSTLVKKRSTQTFTVDANDKVATWSPGSYEVVELIKNTNRPTVDDAVFAGSGSNTTATFTSATTVTVTAGDYDVYVSVGTAPVITDRTNYQTTPGALNITGTLNLALIAGGIVTSTTAAAVAATLDTGAIMDSSSTFAVDDAFIWSAINTGGANAFTVTASSGHTIVGSGTVAASTSARFMTRKTAADTFVTYRI